MTSATALTRLRPAPIVAAAQRAGISIARLARAANVDYDAVSRNRPLSPDEIDRLQAAVDEAAR